MHELSICQALLVQVTGIAQAHRVKCVKQIVVAVGPLSGVEPSLLEEAFRWARAGGCAASAQLTFEQTTVSIRCIECGAESRCTSTCLLCGECGGFRTQVISGDELHLLRVELSSEEEHRWPYGRVN